MSEWKRIGSIAQIRRGASPRPIGDARYFGGDVGWVRIVDVTRAGRFLRQTEQYLSPLGEACSVRVNPGDLVMSICGTIGRPIMIDIPACIHDGFVQFYDLRDTDPIFFFYSLQHAEKAFCAMGQPGTQTNLNTTLVGKHLFFCPDVKHQRRIAEILTTIDDAIEQTEALIAKTQQIKVGLMHDLFTRGVTADGQLRPPRHEAPQLYKESPLGWIPKEWEVNTTEACAARSPGSTTIGPFGSDLVAADYCTAGVPVVFVRDVKEDSFEWNSEVYVTPEKALRLSAHAVKPGDIISTKMGFPPCISCCYPSWMEPGVVTADIVRLRPDVTFVDVRWLSSALNCDSFKRQVQTITAGVTRPKITLADFRKLKLACPKRDEQIVIGDRLGVISMMIETEHARFQKLANLKYGLMHDLLSGHVPVPESVAGVSHG